MQRKMKLIRKLLEHTEMSQTEDPLPVPEIAEYSEAEVHYHLHLCKEAGYLIISTIQFHNPERTDTTISRMTWAGHEALDAMRQETPAC